MAISGPPGPCHALSRPKRTPAASIAATVTSIGGGSSGIASPVQRRSESNMSCARKRFVGCCIHTSIVISDSLTPMARYGPDTGSLQVHTYREGVAAKVGHDLIIEVERWSASDDGGALELTADPTLARRARGQPRRQAAHRQGPRVDRKTIEKDILGRDEIRFASKSVEGGTVKGDLTIAGRTQPVEFDLRREGERVHATVPVVQTRWGIKPYRGFMGALKVRDDVEIVLDAAGA